MNQIEKNYALFVKLSQEMAYLCSARSLLNWDMETTMPKNGSAGRGKAMASIAQVIHEKSISPAYEECLRFLNAAAVRGCITQPAIVNVKRALATFERERKLPTKLVGELQDVCSVAHHAWVKAKEKKDFSIFRPSLEQIVRLTREKGELLNPDNPYDGLLVEYEPGATSAWLASVLTPLRMTLTAFVGKIMTSPHAPNPKLSLLKVPVERQKAFCRNMAEAIGYDFKGGRLDTSEHPFSDRIHPGDLRITSSYKTKNALDAVYSTIHEVGHSLYEGGMPQDGFGLATGSAASFGLHEANSRFWEVMVGRSKAFCEFLAPRLLQGFGIKRHSEELYRSMNAISPGLLRLEADETTYNLHICLRFELERELMAGSLEVADLPEAWNAKMKEYLGVAVPDDASGVLQDVHWSGGSIGYFPSYSLGNIYNAQLYEAMSHDVAYLERSIARGDFAPARAWLAEKVWRHGYTLDAPEIIRQATGKASDATAFLRYIEKKYSEIYKL